MRFMYRKETDPSYRSPGISVIPFFPGGAFCEESDDDPDPGGGEGFGDPSDI